LAGTPAPAVTPRRPSRAENKKLDNTVKLFLETINPDGVVRLLTDVSQTSF
jgi:hypothetical protein